jgi:DNA (cytosine-5)-methyltransferase 1
LTKLKDCGYNVKCKVLDAQWLGVPQMRKRTIFVGVRNDLNIEPVHPKPIPYQYSVGEALIGVEKSDEYKPIVEKQSPFRVANTVVQGTMDKYHWSEPRLFTIQELKRISSFPDDFILHGNLYQKWERVGRAVPPLMMAKVAETIAKEILEKI